MPDIPTMDEFLTGFEASAFYGIGAPKNTPKDLIERLNREINAGLSDSRFRTQLANLGGAMMPGSPADFGNFVVDETEKWGRVIHAANIKAE